MGVIIIKNIKLIIVSISCIIILITLFIIFLVLKNNVIQTSYIKNKQNSNLQIEANKAYLTNYYIYGTSFNIYAHIDLNSEQYSSNIKPYLLFKNLNNENENLTFNTIFTYQDNILNFNISNEINNAINLENISIGKYQILLKIVDETNNTIKYYNFLNNTKYQDIEYYTLTKNKSNNKINIFFENDSLYLDCLNTTNTENIYDITIDAGHGGKDKGAISGNYHESDFTYNISLKLKEKLENIGLKVKLTRENIEDRPSEYGNLGRAVLPNKLKTKYTFSIHLNSCEKDKNYNGVEIYMSSKCNNYFASKLADNILKYANTNYSNKDLEKYSNGVYIRNFTDEDIEESKDDAIKLGFVPYNITTETPYYFIIRETGGIVTNAYVDGRNSLYEKNEFFDSNVVNETYLLELGYINNKTDLNNFINNIDGYVQGIYQSIATLLQ